MNEWARSGWGGEPMVVDLPDHIRMRVEWLLPMLRRHPSMRASEAAERLRRVPGHGPRAARIVEWWLKRALRDGPPDKRPSPT